MDYDGLAWNGPLCPACGTEIDAEVLETSPRLSVVEHCPTCGLLALVPDPFGG
jgi:uncharacterized Zn finger protein